MNRLVALQAQKQSKVKAAQAALDAAKAKATAEGRDLNAEEIAADDAAQRDIDSLNENIRIEQRAIERAAAGPGHQITGGEYVVATDPKRGFADMAEYARAIRNACRPGGGAIDVRLVNGHLWGAPTNVHQEQGTVEGGMVPPAFAQDVWDVVFVKGGLIDLMNPEPTDSDTVKFQADETTPWGATGVIANWRIDQDQMQPKKLISQQRSYELHELYAFVIATDDLIADAPRLGSRLTGKAGGAIGWKAGEAFMTGDGVGKPLGFMNTAAANALIIQTKEGGQSATTFNVQNALKMRSRRLAGMGGRFTMAHIDTLPQLGALALGNQPAFLPSNQGLVGAPEGGYFLGDPLIFSDHCATLGAVGDVVMVEPSGYACAIRRGGIQAASSLHLFFDYAMTAYRWRFKCGGMPVLSAPVTPAKGSNTRSHFVALEAR